MTLTTTLLLVLAAVAPVEAFSPRTATGYQYAPLPVSVVDPSYQVPAVPIKPHVVQEIKAKKSHFANRIAEVRRQALMRSQGLTGPVQLSQYRNPAAPRPLRPTPSGGAYFRSRIEKARQGTLMRNIEAAKNARRGSSTTTAQQFSPVRTYAKAASTAPSRTPQYRRPAQQRERYNTNKYESTLLSSSSPVTETGYVYDPNPSSLATRTMPYMLPTTMGTITDSSPKTPTLFKPDWHDCEPRWY